MDMERIVIRKTEYDLLRILAIFAVIIIHVIGDAFFSMTDVQSIWWNQLNLLNSGLRWCVPVFIMISGSLFLDPAKEITTQQMFRKYIPKIIIAFVFWSVLYTIVDYISFPRNLDFVRSAVDFTITALLKPNYHLWFMYLILGLYLVTPILRLIVKYSSDEILRFWIALMAGFGIVIPALMGEIEFIGSLVGNAMESMDLSFLKGYVFYYVLGYYVSKRPIVHEKFIYVAGLFGYILTVGATNALSRNAGVTTVLYDYLYPNTAMIAIAIFTFFSKQVATWKFSPQSRIWFSNLAACMFGVYLVHDLLIQLLNSLGISIVVYPNMCAVFGIGIIIFIGCCILVWYLRKISICKKYLM